MARSHIIYKILEVSSFAARKTIEALEGPLGFICDIYFPISNDSIYGRRDNTFTYPDTPELADKKFLITGIVAQRFISDSTWDNYEGNDVFMFSNLVTNLPRNSKVVVKFPETPENPTNPDTKFNYITFKIHHRESFHDFKHLYNRYILIPAEARVS